MESTHRRHDLRSLALHEEAVRVLRAHPEKAAVALEVLARWEAKGHSHSRPLWAEWRRLIEGRHWDLAVEDSDRGQQLRQASPLTLVLDPKVREDVFQRFRRDQTAADVDADIRTKPANLDD